MTKFNYPIKWGEPGFEEAVKAIEPGDTVTAVYAPAASLGEPATVTGAAWTDQRRGDTSEYLGLGAMALRFSNGAPYHYLAELVSVEKPPPPSATVEELEALPEGSTIRDEDGHIWVTDGEGTWTCMAAAHIIRATGYVVDHFGPIAIVARAES